MKYCNLMFVHVYMYNKESTALQNCIGKKKHTLAKENTPKANRT